MRALLIGAAEVEESARRTLEARGHAVIAVQDLPADVRESGHDLLLVASELAPAACRALRAAPQAGNAVILALVSPMSSEAELDALLAAGADDVVVRGELREVTRRLLVAEQRASLRSDRARRDEASLRSAETALRETTTMLNSIADGVIACDRAGAVARMNPVAERLTGWSSKDALGRPLSEVFNIIAEDTRAAVESPVSRALGGGTVVGLGNETLLVRRDGTELPVSDSCAPIEDGSGTITGAVLVFHDTSAERSALVARESARRELVVAERMASVGRLAAGIAHEINNPLAYVMSNLDVAIEEIEALGGGHPSGRMAELEDMVREAHRGADRVRKIVRGLRTFSRGEDDRRGLVDLPRVLETSIKLALGDAGQRARLVTSFEKTPLVDADDARLGQVFINLLVNAAQALAEGGDASGTIRVRTRTDATGRAVAEVSNTGPLIPPSQISRIFDPYFTTKPRGVGAGLGLSICQNIVTGMGGEITVTSEEGLGTTFRVVLPPADPKRAVPPRPDAPRTTSPPATVLVVDDEPAVRIVFRRLLADHEVTVVAGAREALDVLAAGKSFDVVFCDLMMPEVSGMDFYYAVAQRFPALAPRMVFITGGAFTREARAFLDCTPNKRLEKPFDANVLRAIVREYANPSRVVVRRDVDEVPARPSIGATGARPSWPA